MPASEDESRRSWQGRHTDDLANQVSFLEQEVAVLRRKLAESPRQARAMEDRLVELQANLSAVTAQNERLVATLKEARDQIIALKDAPNPAGAQAFLRFLASDHAVGVLTKAGFQQP